MSIDLGYYDSSFTPNLVSMNDLNDEKQVGIGRRCRFDDAESLMMCFPLQTSRIVVAGMYLSPAYASVLLALLGGRRSRDGSGAKAIKRIQKSRCFVLTHSQQSAYATSVPDKEVKAAEDARTVTHQRWVVQDDQDTYAHLHQNNGPNAKEVR